MTEAQVKRSLLEMFADILGRPVGRVGNDETLEELGFTSETVTELDELILDLYDVQIQPKLSDSVDTLINNIDTATPKSGHRSDYEE